MSCAICFDDITQATGRVELSCSHSFHYGCLTNWFGNQMSKDIEESCPCCRHVANEHERLPDMESDSEPSSEESEESIDGLEQHIANERAQTRFEGLRLSMPKDALEAYAATRINAVVRGYWVRKAWLYQRSLTEDVELLRRRIRRATVELLTTSRHLKFNRDSLTMGRTKVRSLYAVKIQALWRGFITRKRLTYKEASRVKIHWDLTPDGWKRTIWIAGTLWDGVGLEPQGFAFQAHCASKIQSAWRSWNARGAAQN
jgi:hypothetical protein